LGQRGPVHDRAIADAPGQARVAGHVVARRHDGQVRHDHRPDVVLGRVLDLGEPVPDRFEVSDHLDQVAHGATDRALAVLVGQGQ
jgi:hypothetical protein